MRFVSRKIGFPWSSTEKRSEEEWKRRTLEMEDWLKTKDVQKNKWRKVKVRPENDDAWKTFVRREEIYHKGYLPRNKSERGEFCKSLCLDAFRLYMDAPSWQELLNDGVLMLQWKNKIQLRANLFARYATLEKRLLSLGWNYLFDEQQKSWSDWKRACDWVLEQEEYARHCQRALGASAEGLSWTL